MNTKTDNAKTFPLPPEGFDPREASDSTLRYYGLHRRPDPAVYPELARRWDEVYSKKVTFLQPDLQEANGLPGGPGHGSEALFKPAGVPSINYAFYWSGSVVQSTADDPIQYLVGTFNVPAVTEGLFRPLAEMVTDYIETWLGIGGYNGEFFCRAGVRQSILHTGFKTPDSAPEYTLFMQWFGAKETLIDPKQLAVAPGDMVTILLCVNSPQRATEAQLQITVEHGNTTKQLSLLLESNGYPIVKGSADWIVSRPEYLGVDDLPAPKPVQFQPITFTNAMAFTGSGVQINIKDGTPLNFKVGTQQYTQSTSTGDTSWEVVWDPQP